MLLIRIMPITVWHASSENPIFCRRPKATIAPFRAIALRHVVTASPSAVSSATEHRHYASIIDLVAERVAPSVQVRIICYFPAHLGAFPAFISSAAIPLRPIQGAVVLAQPAGSATNAALGAWEGENMVFGSS
jgi:hypothetical protein